MRRKRSLQGNWQTRVDPSSFGSTGIDLCDMGEMGDVNEFDPSSFQTRIEAPLIQIASQVSQTLPSRSSGIAPSVSANLPDPDTLLANAGLPSQLPTKWILAGALLLLILR